MNTEQEEHARLMNKIVSLESEKTFLLANRFKLLRNAKIALEVLEGENTLLGAKVIGGLRGAIAEAEGI